MEVNNDPYKSNTVDLKGISLLRFSGLASDTDALDVQVIFKPREISSEKYEKQRIITKSCSY